MSHLQVSRYVQAYDLADGNVLLANLFWRTYLELSPEEGALWREAMRSADIDMLSAPVQEKLAKHRMLVSVDMNELKSIEDIYTRRRYSADTLGLTIAPTIDCNFACPYCYEDKRPGRMTREIEDQIITYVDRYLPGRKSLTVIWYGGEPLICKDTILRLSSEFVRISKCHGASYRASMVTNGYLLTEDVADSLAELGQWRNIQITLDGSAPFHDVKRPLRSGKPTFARVYKNLLYASLKLPITLRMNVDLLNVSGCHDLLEAIAIEGAASRIFVYFAPIHGFGSGCRDIDEKPDVKLSSNRQFAAVQSSLTTHATNLGFKTAMPFATSYLPQCQATSTHSIVIEPDGGLHRCWVEVGEDHKRVGHISETIDLTHPRGARWLKFNPARSEPCRSCEVLPLCLGNCPQRHLDGAPDAHICNSIRFNTREMVLAEYMHSTGRSVGTMAVQETPASLCQDDNGPTKRLELPMIGENSAKCATCGTCDI